MFRRITLLATRSSLLTTQVRYKSLGGTATHENLKMAFAGESMANRRYLYFATKADVEGKDQLAAMFRSVAEGETGHAMGHLEFLEEVGDPATNEPMGDTESNLASAIVGETHEYQDMYPSMARTAREEGFDDVADWMETLALAEKSHAGRFQRALADLRAGKFD
jgi:rubrerythrin